MECRRIWYDFRRMIYSQLQRYIVFDIPGTWMHPMKRGRRKIGTKCTGIIAIFLSITFFANVQGGEDEDPGGFGPLGAPNLEDRSPTRHEL